MTFVSELLELETVVTVLLAKIMWGNALLEFRERRGELEPWEVCTCCESGNPAWHLHACHRDAGELAAHHFARLKP